MMSSNRTMSELLAGNPGAAEVDVPSQFRLLVAGGVKQVEGCFFLRSLFNYDYATALAQFKDETGYECAVNSVHIEDYLARGSAREPVALALTGRACAHFLAAELRLFGSELPEPMRFRVIVSVDGTSSTIRFHAIRPEQSWLVNNLDAYGEGVLVMDSDELSSSEVNPT